jgi:hypothetical protein
MVLGAVLFYVHTENLCNGAPVPFLVYVMLEKNYGNNIHENPKYGRSVQKNKNKKENKEGWGVHS